MDSYLPGEYRTGDKRRPDITCFDPRDGMKLVFDVTLCWREEKMRSDGTRIPAAGAYAKERGKIRAYAGGLRRWVRRKKEAAVQNGTAGTVDDDWVPRVRSFRWASRLTVRGGRTRGSG